MTDTLTPLEKVDSAIHHGEEGETKKFSRRRLSSSASTFSNTDDVEGKIRHRRTSSTASNVFNIKDLEQENKDLTIAPETQKLNWKINSSPSTVEDQDYLKKPLTEPMVKAIVLHFPLGLEVTARNLKGVTIKDACDAIYKQFKKKADDELETPYLKGFEWDREECYTRFIVHCKKEGAPVSSKKSKKKGGDKEDEQ